MFSLLFINFKLSSNCKVYKLNKFKSFLGLLNRCPLATIQLFWFSVKFWLKVLKNKQKGFELKYRDSRNAIHFSFFTLQFSRLARKSGCLNKHKKGKVFPWQRNKTYFATIIWNDFDTNVSCFMRTVLLFQYVKWICKECM